MEEANPLSSSAAHLGHVTLLTPPPEGGQEKGKGAKLNSMWLLVNCPSKRFDETIDLGVLVTGKRFGINCGFHN